VATHPLEAGMLANSGIRFACSIDKYSTRRQMKKLLALTIGIGLILGTVSFAQDTTDTTKKTDKKGKKKKGGDDTTTTDDKK
jgi:hypothetical protein